MLVQANRKYRRIQNTKYREKNTKYREWNVDPTTKRNEAASQILSNGHPTTKKEIAGVH